MIRQKIMSSFIQSFIQSTNQNHFKFATWFIVSHTAICGCLQFDKFYNFLHGFVFYHSFYLEKCGLGKMLRFLIKSCLLSRSHQNHFKFDVLIYCIMPICDCKLMYIIFLHFCVVFFSLFLPKKIWPMKMFTDYSMNLLY